MEDFYKVLNVDKEASADEIKKAYKKLAKKYHPDLNQGDKDAETKFKEINLAYEVLSDDQKRRNYDLYGEDAINGNFQGSSGFGGFSDIFGDIFDIFGDGFRNSYTSDPRDIPIKGSDIKYELNLDFREAVFGVEKEISIRRREECKECHGSGAKEGTGKHTCSKCHGSGKIKIQTNSPFGRFTRVVTCDKCKGTGEIIDQPCGKCSGLGTEMTNKKINVKVPAGVDNNNIVSMKGEGNVGQNKGPNGDLLIYINIKEDSVFKRSGKDLHISLPISYMDAVLGGKIKVPTLTSLVDFEIPAGTEGGTTFKLKSEGVKGIRTSNKGDLYFTVDIIVPKKLNDEQRQLLETLREKSLDIHEERKGFFNKVKEFFE